MQHPTENQSPGRAHFPRASDVTCAYDLSGKITFLSEEGERISGYTSAEACRMNISELLDQEIAGRVGEEILRSAQEQIGTVYEIDLIARNGQRVAVEVSTRIVLGEDEAIEVQGVAVPSVIRSRTPTPMRLRCLDESFFVGSSAPVPEVEVCTA